jgi:hypothetical protein
MNIGADAASGEHIRPVESNGVCQGMAEREATVVAVFSGAAGKGGPANVMVAEAEGPAVVAAEAGISAQLKRATQRRLKLPRKEYMSFQIMRTREEPTSANRARCQHVLANIRHRADTHWAPLQRPRSEEEDFHANSPSRVG